MKKKVFLLCMVLFVTLNVFSMGKKSNKIQNFGTITNEDFGIKTLQGENLQLFSSIHQLKEFDSKSGKQTYAHPLDDNYSWFNADFNDLEVTWVSLSGYVIHIITESPKYQTRRGIGIGSNTDDILKAYDGNKAYINDNKIEYDLGSAEFETVLALIFYLKENKVYKIEIMEGN